MRFNNCSAPEVKVINYLLISVANNVRVLPLPPWCISYLAHTSILYRQCEIDRSLAIKQTYINTLTINTFVGVHKNLDRRLQFYTTDTLLKSHRKLIFLSNCPFFIAGW